jgi:tetratricopeptide (TPR) repeat protein
MSSANARRRAVRLGQTAAAASLAVPASSLAAHTPIKPLAVSASPEVERLLDEAWGLIERGDLGPGRTRLLTARKTDPEDPRADFSLGLLDALNKQDWDSAAKHFGDCLRRDRENIPTLNNLAIVLVQSKREGEAAKHWKAIVSQRPGTAEVVQNVGVVRHLMDEGMLRKNNSLRQSLEHLYTEAAVATRTTAQPQAGFRFMTLALSDGRSVGFSNPKKMQLATWSPAPEASPSARPAGAQPAARGPGAAGAGNQPSQPGPPGAAPATANARQTPAANVPANPAASAPYIRRPAFSYPRR